MNTDPLSLGLAFSSLPILKKKDLSRRSSRIAMYSHPSCALHNSIHIVSNRKGACRVVWYSNPGFSAVCPFSVHCASTFSPSWHDYRRCKEGCPFRSRCDNSTLVFLALFGPHWAAYPCLTALLLGVWSFLICSFSTIYFRVGLGGGGFGDSGGKWGQPKAILRAAFSLLSPVPHMQPWN